MDLSNLGERRCWHFVIGFETTRFYGIYWWLELWHVVAPWLEVSKESKLSSIKNAKT